MGKKQFCFFQTAETGNRTPDSGVKGSGANHYPSSLDVLHILFINPLLTRLSQVLTLCGLEYHVSYVLTLCRLHYHVYLILTYSCLELHRCYLSTLYRLQFDVYYPLRSRGSISSRVSRVLPICGLDYHISSILTFSYLEFHMFYLLILSGLE